MQIDVTPGTVKVLEAAVYQTPNEVYLTLKTDAYWPKFRTVWIDVSGTVHLSLGLRDDDGSFKSTYIGVRLPKPYKEWGWECLTGVEGDMCRFVAVRKTQYQTVPCEIRLVE